MRNDLVQRLQAQRAASEIIPRYQESIKEEEQYGTTPPQVYLIGESHVEQRHMRFATDVILAARPIRVYYEGAAAETRPTPHYLSLRELMERTGVEEALPAVIGNLKETKHKEQTSFPRPKALIDEQYYMLSDDYCALLFEALGKTITKEAKPLIAEIREREREMRRKGDLQESSKLWDTHIWLGGPSRNERINSSYINDPLLKGLITVYEGLAIVDHTIRHKERVGRHGNKVINREREELLLEDTVGRVGAVLHPWDDQRVKEIILQNLGRLHSSNETALNTEREKTMRRLLLASVKKPGIVVTYGGADHIQPSGIILEGLREANISYHAFYLGTDDNQSMRNLKNHLYTNKLRHN